MSGSERIGKRAREILEDVLPRLEMVAWDRFVVGEDYHGDRYVNVYGWIERDEDDYKDFVVVRCWPDLGEDGIIGFTTSSDRYTEEIHRLLFGEEAADGHNPCRRVEHALDVENAIELAEDATLDEYTVASMEVTDD